MIKKLFRKKKKAASEKPEKKPNDFIISGNAESNSVDTNGATVLGKCEIRFWRDSQDNVVTVGQGCKFNNLRIIFKGHGNRVELGDQVEWTGQILVTGKNQVVSIGNKTVAKGVNILSRGGNVTIGAECLLSREIEIRTTDTHKIYDLDSNQQINPPGETVIADRVWIAARVIVSKGVTVPRGCVIGAASFVNRKFDEENSVIAGSPAKVVRQNIRWER